MQVFQSKHNKLPGTDLEEIVKLARHEYHIIQKRSPRRRPYVRSSYFTKDKIFINNFWEHLNQKSPKERVRRLKLYTCAIDLLRNSALEPDTIYTHVDMNVGLHRFYGQTKSGDYYCVQIQENKRNNRKEFISVFPVKKPSK
jgi:hypothetical protein